MNRKIRLMATGLDRVHMLGSVIGVLALFGASFLVARLR